MPHKPPINKTELIPVASIYQNHLDDLHDLLEHFCNSNKGAFEWHLVEKNQIIQGAQKIKHRMKAAKPKTLRYRLRSISNNEQYIMLIIDDNGMTLSIRKGSYNLYGCMSSIRDHVSSIATPKTVFYLRRHWVASVAAFALLLLPIMLLTWASLHWGWLVFLPGFIYVTIVILLIVCALDFIEKRTGAISMSNLALAYKQLIPAASIKYDQYSGDKYPPSYQAQVASAALSNGASAATILAFLFRMM